MDETVRRLFGFKPQQKFFKSGTRTFGLEEDALRGIIDPAGELKFGGEPKDERTETNPLHRAANGDLQSQGWQHIHHN